MVMTVYSGTRFDVKKVELRTVFSSRISNFHKVIFRLIPFKRFLNIFLRGIFNQICFELEVIK